MDCTICVLDTGMAGPRVVDEGDDEDVEDKDD